MTASLPLLDQARVAVIGLGYVGLPLAVRFAMKRPTIGFDINERRISELQSHEDRTREVDTAELRGVGETLALSADPDCLNGANVFIITAPTPIDTQKRPDLGPLLTATRTVAAALKPGDVVIYESTVYPGATEEDCAPILEGESGLKLNTDFFLGYSPERVNPGDRNRTLDKIVKVTAGSTPDAAEFIDSLYAQIIPAGTYKAESIRVAEAAKVIENTQRDLNIALVNELAIIFNRIGIDSEAVLNAAGTKWNFLPFRPGLVGGHCIGVDPYYLTHKAEAVGYHPQVILAGRRINDGMGAYAAGQLVKAMIKRRIQVHGARVLIMGLTFKENCPDLRNTRVVDLVSELADYGVQVDINDPWAEPEVARTEYALELTANPTANAYDGIIVAVAHSQYRDLGAAQIRALGAPNHVLFDLKSIFLKSESDLRL